MKKLALVAALSAFSLGAFAAEPKQDPGTRPVAAQKKDGPSEQDMKKAMEATYGAMVPIVEKMVEATIEARLKSAEKPESATRIAEFKKRLYDALILQGFSRDEALQITINTPLPTASLF